MYDKIKTKVASLLASAPDCPEKTEIAEEMTQNLTDKYNDLVADGYSPDEAYREVIAGIGDANEIVDFIRAAHRPHSGDSFRSAEPSGNPFVSFEDRVRDWSENLARSIEEPMRAMADDLKSASKQFKANAKNTGWERSYQYTLSAEGIRSLNVKMRAGDLRLSLSPDNEIHITERSRADLREDQRISCEVHGGCLHISQGRSYVGFFFFGFGVISSDLEIALPMQLLESVSVSGVSDFDAGELTCRSLSIKTVSGDIEVKRLNAQTLSIESISGDIEIGGNIDSADINVKSGDIKLRDVSAGSLTVEQISGALTFSGSLRTLSARSKSGDTNINTRTLPEALSIESISGDVRLALPENDGFSIQYRQTSGDFKTEFDMLAPLNSRSGTASYKGEPQPLYTISLVSGDIRIARGF